MKLACSSTAFDRQLASGDLTQLEWIDLCARDLATDGVILDVRHFPRTDGDYLAQVKKMATDLGLTVAALYDGAFFDAVNQETLDIAVAVGAPLVGVQLPSETQVPWSTLLEQIGTATSRAKALNVTLALRNAPGTFAASTHDMKRVSKEADSAWLRYGPEFAALDAASEPHLLLPKTVLVWQPFDRSDALGTARLAELLHAFRGYLVLDAVHGGATIPEMQRALRTWRNALAESLIDRT